MIPVNRLLAVPLNLPRAMPDTWEKFWDVWQEDAKPYVRKKPDIAGNNNPRPPWHGFVWEFEQPHVLGVQGMWDVPTKNYSNIFPRWREQLEAMFPFRIHRIVFQSNYNEIGLHRDGILHTDTLDYPCAVRIMVIDTNVAPNFYYGLSKDSKEKFYQHLPESTNTWVYHNPRVWHGAEYHGHFKVLGQVIFDKVDEDRWFGILQDSYSAWPDLCMIRK